MLELIAYGDGSSENAVEVLLIRVSDDDLWHRIYLDAGIGFWQVWTRAENFDDYAGQPELNLAERWDLHRAEIQSADCLGTPIDQPGLSQFRFVLSAGILTLHYADAVDVDSATLVDFK